MSSPENPAEGPPPQDPDSGNDSNFQDTQKVKGQFAIKLKPSVLCMVISGVSLFVVVVVVLSVLFVFVLPARPRRHRARLRVAVITMPTHFTDIARSMASVGRVGPDTDLKPTQMAIVIQGQKPNKPGGPVASGDSGGPVASGNPSGPVATVKPVATVRPIATGVPVATSSTISPSGPVATDRPVTTSEPVATDGSIYPGDPGGSGGPVVSVAPGGPVGPGGSVDPGTPSEPVTTGVPVTSDDPGGTTDEGLPGEQGDVPPSLTTIDYDEYEVTTRVGPGSPGGPVGRTGPGGPPGPGVPSGQRDGPSRLTTIDYDEYEDTTRRTDRPRRIKTTTEKLLQPKFRVGMGIADISMPSVEFAMMGIWSNAFIPSTGIHTRQYSRAFCFVHGSKRVVLVVAEIYAVNYYIRYQLLESFNQTISHDFSFTNVHLLATMTHWAPGCHAAEYMNGLGPSFSFECSEALVLGLKRSVLNACATTTPVRLFYSSADIYYSTINRAPEQYVKNPDLERFAYATSHDFLLLQLRIENRYRRIIGMINFVPVRANALPYNNNFLSSDSLGMASMRLESRYNPGKPPGKASYLMAFVPTNIGDISPHVDGGICSGNKIPCISYKDCHHRYGFGGCYSAPVSHQNFFVKAEAVANNLLVAVNDAISARGAELRTTLEVVTNVFYTKDQKFFKYDPINKIFTTKQIELCEEVRIGEFWPEPFDVRDEAIKRQEVREYMKNNMYNRPRSRCHLPAAFWDGRNKDPKYVQVVPTNVTVTLVNLCGFILVLLPGEPTTMVGRRVVNVVGKVMKARKQHTRATVVSNANEYFYYFGTYDEIIGWNRDQFVGMARPLTIRGKYSEDWILNLVNTMSEEVLNNAKSMQHVDDILGEYERTFHERTININHKKPVNIPPRFKNFCDIVRQPILFIRRGSLLVVRLIASNPRVNLHTEGSHYYIEKRCNRQWVVLYRDSAWETTLNFNAATMEVTIQWRVPPNVTLGMYRLRYFSTANKKEFVCSTHTFSIN